MINPRTRIILNGTWQLQPTNDEAVPTSWNHTVPVPSVVDAANPKHDWKSFKYHWHRTTFEVAKKSDLAFIVIEQAMFGTDVWLNGKHLGGDIACYTSQEYDARTAIRAGKTNELIVRVGQREHLPPESAVGKDQERTDWIPGIWGDVYLLQCGNPRVQLVQVIPHIETGIAEVRITVENRSGKTVSCTLSSTIVRKKQKTAASEPEKTKLTITKNGTEVIVFNQKIARMQLWSPDNPFLYEVETTLKSGNRKLDSLRTSFGMRDFKVVGSDFYFNGKRIFLRGGNIAFHRFLPDADRGTLPWNLDWIKKLLIDIPKAHSFNFFRNHIGQMYNRWYDIADEHGMLLQNEWMFWTTTGTKEQITKEFTRWLRDNWNHPSIIIWDALNECSDEVVQKEIVPEMKKLDPTRPWESVDFVEEHPYIYSLGPVLNDRKLGFTRSLDEIEHSSKPTMLNEFCWWWLDKDFNPALLTKDVVERWLGPNWTKEQLIAHQSFLVTELVEMFRRMRVDAIQPFVYLSNNAGPTANWFVGDIKELSPKPILIALKNVFAPFGVSIELWDRHFVPNEHRSARAFVFNDEPVENSGILRYGVVNSEGKWQFETKQPVIVEASGCEIIPVTIQLPPLSGDFTLRAELYESETLVAISPKHAHVIEPVEVPHRLREARLALLAKGNELREFVEKNGLSVVSLPDADLRDCDVLIVGEGMLSSPSYQVRLGAITKFLEAGKTVIVLEPEFDIEEAELLSVALGVDLAIEKREDPDKGGYDSYVFADDLTHPLWRGISQEHLKMFNGGYGGEVVSQHNVTATVQHTVLARCGLHLGVMAVCEIPVGDGRIIVSRLQLRGRLAGSQAGENRFARRMDPVLQKYFVNLLAYAAGI
jgi:hypothetical protein